ncbi:hypothetical protein F4809DRAFT_48629 [Biscogniauxia mediterranea]|nr:hypothetical protein F4809DRAFT_48629 [Biscogniauxia mediterranea]
MDSEDEYLPGNSASDGEDLGKLEEQDEEPDELPEATKPRGAGTARKRRSKSRQPASPPPLKRARGAFSIQYLNLLNEDIRDAAAGIVHEGGAPLGHTQVGAVGWSAAEKAAFFAALGRLGQDDLAGIAARVRTKSEPEVRQYMMLLDDYDRDRRADEVKRRRALPLADIPAAAEISQACCAALEEAADGVALRQERHEEALEQKRWRGRWLVTPALAQALESQHRRGQELGLPFAELFAVRNWLRLSDRVFMNSAVPDGNWRCVEEQPPLVRATAFADFHALALSVTRRLLLASLYVAESRVRAKNAGDPRHRTRPLVRPHDVRVAAASVGLKEDARVFWARCARRLRLDVYDDDDDDDNNEQPLRGGMEVEKRDDATISTDDDLSNNGAESYEDEDEDRESTGGEEDMETDTDQDTEYDIMTYDAVEAALGLPQPGTSQDMTAAPPDGYGDDDDEDDLSDALSTISSDSEEAGAEAEAEAEAPVDEADADARLDPAAIERDLDEVMLYSALPHPGTTRAKQSLRARIRREHLLEAEAERVDARAGAREEARLWARLRGEGEGEEREEQEDDREREEDVKDGVSAAATAPTDTEGGDDEGDEEYTEEGDGEEESGMRGRRRRRKSQAGRPAAPLVELGSDWRDGLTYYSEWETLRRRGAQVDR